jgi:hypothetical protein
MSLESELKKLTSAVITLTELLSEMDTIPGVKKSENPISDAEITVDDIRSLMMAVKKKFGDQSVIKALADMNAQKLSDVAEKDYIAFASNMKAQLKEEIYGTNEEPNPFEI